MGLNMSLNKTYKFLTSLAFIIEHCLPFSIPVVGLKPNIQAGCVDYHKPCTYTWSEILELFPDLFLVNERSIRKSIPTHTVVEFFIIVNLSTGSVKINLYLLFAKRIIFSFQAKWTFFFKCFVKLNWKHTKAELNCLTTAKEQISNQIEVKMKEGQGHWKVNENSNTIRFF